MFTTKEGIFYGTSLIRRKTVFYYESYIVGKRTKRMLIARMD